MTIPSLLKENGYNTAMVGKWHLQMDFADTKGENRDWSQPFTEGPIEHGFDYFFGIPASMNYGVLTYLENDRVLDPLKQNGLEENTLVIFSSDNGAETNYKYWRDNYGHWSSMNFKGGKRNIYEGGHRVPFLMRWPEAIKAGSKVDGPVCQSDYLATIADIVGAELPDYAAEDSYSLLPLISEKTKGEYRSDRDALYELYNMETDPGETTNLYFEYPEIVNELKAEISKIIKSGRSTPGTPQEFVKGNWDQITWMEI